MAQTHKPLFGGEHFLTGKEVCERLYISPRTLQDYRDRKIIPYTQFAGKILYKVLDLERLLEKNFNPSLTPTFAYSWQSSYFPRFSYGLCVLQILFFLYGECFKFNLSYICFACFEGLLHWRISMFSPNGFFPFVVTSFWVLIRRTISVQ